LTQNQRQKANQRRRRKKERKGNMAHEKAVTDSDLVTAGSFDSRAHPPFADIIADLQICDEEELAIYNEPGEANRELIQHAELRSKVYIKTTLQHIRYGTFRGSPAALLIFRSQFFHSNSSGANRIKSSILKFSFADADSPNDLSKAPRVLSIFPLHAKSSHATVRTVTDEFKLSLGPRSTLPNMHHAHSVTSTQRRYTEINGIVTTSTRKSPRAENRVLWMIDEDEVAKDGVPRFFEGLVVLHHRETPFQMVMDVETFSSAPQLPPTSGS
jgi:hypothetical protein